MVRVGNICRMRYTVWYNYICFNCNANQQYISVANVRPPGGGTPRQWITALQLWAGGIVPGSVCTGSVYKVTEGDSPQHPEEPSISLITVHAMVSNHIMINRRLLPSSQIDSGGTTSESIWIREQRRIEPTRSQINTRAGASSTCLSPL